MENGGDDCGFAVDLELEVAFNGPPPAPIRMGKETPQKISYVTAVELTSASKSVPYIYCCPGGRRDGALAIDRRLHGTNTFPDYVRVVRQWVDKFDPGNTVVAVSQAAKVAEAGKGQQQLSGHPVWTAILAQMAETAEKLEPRGLSMAAYAFAKLDVQDEAVLSALAQAGERRSRDFSAMDIAKMCWALARLGFTRGAFASFWEAIAFQVPKVVRDGRQHEISMMAWAFATAEVGNAALFQAIGQANLILLHELSPQSLSNILWAFATVRIEDPDLVQAIRRRAWAVLNDFVEFDVVNFTWSLAQMDLVDEELFRALAAHTVAAGLCKRFTTTMAMQMIWAYAHARVVHKELMATLAAFVTRHAAVLDPGQTATIAWGLALMPEPPQDAFAAIAQQLTASALWTYELDELGSLCWAYAKIQWIQDPKLFADVMHVLKLRFNELNGESVANVLWGLTHLYSPAMEEARLDAPAFAEDLDTVTDLIYNALCARTVHLPDAEAARMAVWAYGEMGRPTHASHLQESLHLH